MAQYGAEYFRGYTEKREAIQDLYFKYLKWADLLNGRGKTALDVGAAFGYVVELLSKLGYDAVGIDISPYACSKSTHVILGDVHSLPFKSNSFDLITCLEVIEHLANPIIALSRFHDLLKHEGILLTITPTLLGEKATRKFFRNYPHYSGDFKSTEQLRDAYHPSIKHWNDWIKILFASSFKEIRWRHFNLTPILLGKYRVMTSPTMFAIRIAIKATKP